VTLFQVEIPVATGLAALAAIAFMIARARQREREFSLVDSLLLVILMSIAAAGGVTLVEAASAQAKETALRENLRMFRTQIEAYRLQHGGESPVLYKGSFPQLTEATDRRGMPGQPDSKHPYGPYFRAGIPVNPITGRWTVTLTDKSPPSRPSGHGGWLYHQQSGRITADLAEFLAE
jgi:type II secretory pathway pseudopilin PulG